MSAAVAAAVRLGVEGPLVLRSVGVQLDVAVALPLDETGGGPPRPDGVHAAQRGFLVQVREWPLSRPFCSRKACGVVRDRDSDGDTARDRDGDGG